MLVAPDSKYSLPKLPYPIAPGILTNGTGSLCTGLSLRYDRTGQGRHHDQVAEGLCDSSLSRLSGGHRRLGQAGGQDQCAF